MLNAANPVGAATTQVASLTLVTAVLTFTFGYNSQIGDVAPGLPHSNTFHLVSCVVVLVLHFLKITDWIVLALHPRLNTCGVVNLTRYDIRTTLYQYKVILILKVVWNTNLHSRSLAHIFFNWLLKSCAGSLLSGLQDGLTLLQSSSSTGIPIHATL